MNGTSHQNKYSRFVSVFKLTGWSVRHHANSLVEFVSSIGKLVKYIHLPQLHTTYVAVKLPLQTPCLAHLVSQQFPSLQVEESNIAFVEGIEETLQSNKTTAFMSCRQMLRESDVSAELRKFGSIRAFHITYSYKSAKWICRVTFYESYSLDRLLASNQKVPFTLSDGSPVKVQKIRNSILDYTTTESRDFISKSHQLQAPLVHSCLVSQNDKQRGQAAIRKQNRRSTISKSCEREVDLVLPSQSTFKYLDQYLEVVLDLNNSHHQQASKSSRYCQKVLTSRKRSNSSQLVKTTKAALKFNISFKDNCVGNDFNGSVEVKELLFLQIRRESKKNYDVTICRAREELDGCYKLGSYLSADDLSDGYSAQEECPDTLHPSLDGFQQARSDKDQSQVPLTMYSSDIEQSDERIETSIGRDMPCFDHYFGFGSENMQLQVPVKQYYQDYNYSNPTIDYFSFPSY